MEFPNPEAEQTYNYTINRIRMLELDLDILKKRNPVRSSMKHIEELIQSNVKELAKMDRLQQRFLNKRVEAIALGITN
jgi:hypothetical protein